MHPNSTIGGIQDHVWLENDMVAVVTTNGYLRLLQHNVADGSVFEDQHKPCEGGVVSACLCKSTGHIAVVSSDCVTFFNPLLLNITHTLTIPQVPDGARYHKIQSDPSGKFLLLGRTDGRIFRIQVPDMDKIDLSLLTVRRQAKSETTVTVGKLTQQAAALMLGASCGAPRKMLTVSAAEGATCGFGAKMLHAWSNTRSLLAAVNDRKELLVVQLTADGSIKRLMKEQLPDAIVHLSWDPTSQSVLAIAIRSYGIALWDTKTDNGVQMWSGMAYKSKMIALRKSTRTFDPAVAVWNLGGQLAVGMHDGSFAVWDSMSMDISTSGSSGKHRSPITAGGWYSSMFAPALALASKSTIKVSQGFDGVEWSATSMKLKMQGSPAPRISLTSPLGRSRAKSTANADLEGLHFELLKFSPSGKLLAAIVSQVADPENRQVVVYELQDERKSLSIMRELNFADGERPLSFEWLMDNSLVIFVRAANGGGLVKYVAPLADLPATTWPRDGPLPGTLVDAIATTQGLLVLASSSADSKGKCTVVTCPSMNVVVEMYACRRATGRL